jgi:flagellar hook-length control protein FliK
MRLSLDLTGADWPAAPGARLAGNSAEAAGDAALFDLSALLPMLAVEQPAPQPAALPALALGADAGASAQVEGAVPAGPRKTLPLIFLRPNLDAMPADTVDMKADAAHREAEPASAKSVIPAPAPLMLLPAAPEPGSILPPVAVESISVEHVMSALDTPAEPSVAAVDLLKAQLLTAAAKVPATEGLETERPVSAPQTLSAPNTGATAIPAAQTTAPSYPMLMAEVAHETAALNNDAPAAATTDAQHGVAIDTVARAERGAQAPRAADRGVSPLKPADRESERRVPAKGEPAPAVTAHDAAVVRPAAAAQHASADHDAHREIRTLTANAPRPSASPLSVIDSPAERTPISELPSRLIESMRMQIKAGGGQAEIRLSPEFLGSVRVSIVVDHGSVRATLTADTPAALDTLRADLAQLKEALAERGLRLDEFELREDPSAGREPGGGDPQARPDDERQRRQQREQAAAGGPAFGEAFDVVA